MWFAQSAVPSGLGFSVFDGSNWKTYTPGNGLPANLSYVGQVFGDSKGRIWFGTSILDPNYPNDMSHTKTLGLWDSGVFKYFGQGMPVIHPMLSRRVLRKITLAPSGF
jgi:hypothetical protein